MSLYDLLILAHNLENITHLERVSSTLIYNDEQNFIQLTATLSYWQLLKVFILKRFNIILNCNIFIE
ncbi:unnamed protein product [Paramecium octaurelia]|uniref:Uncharacterized protein n=1 Tax=Paramecium octaurelia TaxID=43137 RepID=A0A8S1VD31_PAROT|nr:unnamed protein product [Paramecium octaurelia]